MTGVKAFLVALICLHFGLTSAATTSTSSVNGVTQSATVKLCTLAAEKDIPLEIKHMLTDGAKLIRYHLNIPEWDSFYEGNSTNQMFQPLFWARATGRQGTRLLLLRPNFDRISLQTLRIGVKTINVDVAQDPPNCLRNLDDDEKEVLLRKLIIHDFQNTSSGLLDLDPEDSVCNQRLVDKSGTAQFKYMCCQKNEYGEIRCKFLESDTWLDILFVAITVIEVIVFLFSPRLVPEVLYRAKHIAASYIFSSPPGKKIVFNTTLTKEPDLFPNEGVKIKLSKLREMEEFKKYISRMKMGETRQAVLDTVNLRVKYDRVLPRDYAPVQWLTAIYDSFFRCNIRRRDAVRDCCDADFISKSPCCKRLSWFKVLRGFMRVFLLLLLAVPWVLRVLAYYRWENDDISQRKEAAKAMGLSIPFPGNITLLLTPWHVVFICIYVVLVLEACIFGVLSRRVQEKLKMVIRQCFRDMSEISKRKVFGWVVRVCIKPCKDCGGLGLLIGVIYWILAFPVMVLIVAFYVLPTINITIRLMFYFVVNLFPKKCFSNKGCCACIYRALGGLNSQLDIDKITKQNTLHNKLLSTFTNRLLQLFVIFMCLISMYSIIFLIMELASFVVEVIVYVMMGIIVNAGSLMTYFALIIIVGLYGSQCFGNVTDKFNSFNKTLHDVVIGTCKEKVDRNVYTNTENVAFMVKTSHSSDVKSPIELTKSDDGVLQWGAKRLCLFLSKNDEPLIPYEFYYRACRMPYYAAPGELLISYLFATMEFGAILLFLFFVLIVVMAFGQSYDLSITNQLLATVFGGMIPFLFRKVFKPKSFPTIDEGSIHFQTSFNDLLDDYVEEWPVYDININQYEQPGVDTTEEEISEDQIDVETRSYQNNTDDQQGDVSFDYRFDLVIDARKIDPDDFPDIINPKSGSSDTSAAEYKMTITDTESLDGEIEVNDVYDANANATNIDP